MFLTVFFLGGDKKIFYNKRNKFKKFCDLFHNFYNFFYFFFFFLVFFVQMMSCRLDTDVGANILLFLCSSFWSPRILSFSLLQVNGLSMNIPSYGIKDSLLHALAYHSSCQLNIDIYKLLGKFF